MDGGVEGEGWRDGVMEEWSGGGGVERWSDEGME